MFPIFADFSKIDLNKEVQDLRPFLAFPNRTIICELHEAYDKNHTIKLGSLNELSFIVPYEVDRNHKLIRNPNIDNIKRRFLIKAQSGIKFEWYIIDEITDNAENNSKEIHAFSLEYELIDKRIIRYECTSYNASQVLHDALDQTIWNIGYIDGKFDVKYRSFNISSKTVLDFIYEIANTFGALVIFDTENRTVNFYDLENYGVNKGLYLSYDKYLKDLNRNENLDNIKTRLKAFGRDGLSIHEVNITGQNYIEDFSYYMYPFERDENRNVLKHSAYGMSDNLCHAILDYNELLVNKQGEFQGYLNSKKALQQTKTIEENELDSLQEELEVIKDNIDIAQANNFPVGDLIEQKEQKETDVSIKQIELNSINEQLSVIKNNIANLHIELKTNNNFTSEQIIELNPYIIEEEWVNENYIDAQDLYDEAVRRLNELKVGTPIIEVDIVNFLQIVTEQRDWDKLGIGDIVNVQYDKFNINIQAKITEININYEDGDIKLIISNIKDVLSDKEKFLKMIQTSVSTSTEVSMDKYKWNGADAKVNDVEAILNNVWDDNKKQISMNVNESVDISRRGIIIKDLNDLDKMLIAQHGILALSQDGGNTWKHAIRPDGIIGERIIGKILVGQNLAIDASNNEGQKVFTVNETGVEISGMALKITDGGLPVSQLASGVLLENKLYNGVKIDTTDGLVITRSDNKVRSVSNATNGFSIEKYEGSQWVKRLYADINGNLNISGNIKIGTGNAVFKADTSGIYLGSDNYNYAPFRVNLSGNLIATAANIQGDIDCSSLKIAGINVLDELYKFNGNYLSNNSVGANKIKTNELIVGDNIQMGPDAYISWGNVTSRPFIPQTAYDVGARPDTWTPSSSDLPSTVVQKIGGNYTYLDATKIASPYIEGGRIVGGSIESNTVINVGTSATIGKQLILSTSNYGAGIKWGTGPDSTSTSIYIDPAGGGMFLYNPNGGIYANNKKIDQATVAVFG